MSIIIYNLIYTANIMFSKFVLNTTTALSRRAKPSFCLQKQLLSIPQAGIYFKDTELDKSKYDQKKAENLMEREYLSAQL